MLLKNPSAAAKISLEIKDMEFLYRIVPGLTVQVGLDWRANRSVGPVRPLLRFRLRKCSEGRAVVQLRRNPAYPFSAACLNLWM